MNETRRDDTTRAEPAADAVERVHKAICGALVMMGYSPIEFVVDGTMTAMARAALQAAAVPTGDDTDLTTAYMTGYLAGKDDDAAIAAFESALLSDEVVEAAAEAIRSTADAFFSGREVEQITSVKSAKQAFDRLYRQQARAALQAAIAAAKGTEDEQEDCGCTSIDYGWYGNDGGIVSVIQCSDEGCPRANKGMEGSA